MLRMTGWMPQTLFLAEMELSHYLHAIKHDFIIVILTLFLKYYDANLNYLVIYFSRRH